MNKKWKNVTRFPQPGSSLISNSRNMALLQHPINNNNNIKAPIFDFHFVMTMCELFDIFLNSMIQQVLFEDEKVIKTRQNQGPILELSKLLNVHLEIFFYLKCGILLTKNAY